MPATLTELQTTYTAAVQAVRDLHEALMDAVNHKSPEWLQDRNEVLLKLRACDRFLRDSGANG